MTQGSIKDFTTHAVWKVHRVLPSLCTVVTSTIKLKSSSEFFFFLFVCDPIPSSPGEKSPSFQKKGFFQRNSGATHHTNCMSRCQRGKKKSRYFTPICINKTQNNLKPEYEIQALIWIPSISWMTEGAQHSLK